jgi:hypothetical protein
MSRDSKSFAKFAKTFRKKNLVSSPKKAEKMPTDPNVPPPAPMRTPTGEVATTIAVPLPADAPPTWNGITPVDTHPKQPVQAPSEMAWNPYAADPCAPPPNPRVDAHNAIHARVARDLVNAAFGPKGKR